MATGTKIQMTEINSKCSPLLPWLKGRTEIVHDIGMEVVSSLDNLETRLQTLITAFQGPTVREAENTAEEPIKEPQSINDYMNLLDRRTNIIREQFTKKLCDTNQAIKELENHILEKNVTGG